MTVYILEIGLDSHYTTIENMVHSFIFKNYQEAKAMADECPEDNRPEIIEIEI